MIPMLEAILLEGIFKDVRYAFSPRFAESRLLPRRDFYPWAWHSEANTRANLY